jgi:two-component system sensor histidine kinase UhpB
VIFRVAQEALSNASRHAQVDCASLGLSISLEEARLVVDDQGVGFDLTNGFVPPHGWGLAGMRERVESVGGKLVIDSASGKGTRVEVVIPLCKPAEVGLTGIKEINNGQNDSPDAGRRS